MGAEFRLGIDVGRVLIAPDDPSAPDDTSFLGSTIEDAVRTRPCDGMFDVVPEVVSRFEGRVWLISKCGPRVQEKTRRWLAHHRFFERTGVNPAHLRFCLERPQKALHCAELGITHFIDDRRDVLEAMQAVVPNLYLFGPQSSRHPADSRFIVVETWRDLQRSIP
jgi:hypothetical protein